MRLEPVELPHQRRLQPGQNLVPGELRRALTERGGGDAIEPVGIETLTKGGTKTLRAPVSPLLADVVLARAMRGEHDLVRDRAEVEKPQSLAAGIGDRLRPVRCLRRVQIDGRARNGEELPVGSGHHHEVSLQLVAEDLHPAPVLENDDLRARRARREDERGKNEEHETRPEREAKRSPIHQDLLQPFSQPVQAQARSMEKLKTERMDFVFAAIIKSRIEPEGDPRRGRKPLFERREHPLVRSNGSETRS